MKCYVSQFHFVSTCEFFFSCSIVEVRLKTKVSDTVSRWIEVNAQTEKVLDWVAYAFNIKLMHPKT